MATAEAESVVVGPQSSLAVVAVATGWDPRAIRRTRPDTSRCCPSSRAGSVRSDPGAAVGPSNLLDIEDHYE